MQPNDKAKSKLLIATSLDPSFRISAEFTWSFSMGTFIASITLELQWPRIHRFHCQHNSLSGWSQLAFWGLSMIRKINWRFCCRCRQGRRLFLVSKSFQFSDDHWYIRAPCFDRYCSSIEKCWIQREDWKFLLRSSTTTSLWSVSFRSSVVNRQGRRAITVCAGGPGDPRLARKFDYILPH